VRLRPDSPALLAATALTFLAGCSPDSPTSPTVPPMADVSMSHIATLPTDVPTGERIVGNKAAIEPAYNADSGDLMYLLTPINAPLPSRANGHATSPLYIVEYPTGSTAAGGGHLNCEGIPGNCPDHDGQVADAAAGYASGHGWHTYDNGVVGHDHVADPPGKPDFNIAWEVWEVVFTPQGVSDGAVNTRLTTDTAIMAAQRAGDVDVFDLGFAFNCSVVSASLYWKGTPIGG
jgi:hypothetical protein